MRTIVLLLLLAAAPLAGAAAPGLQVDLREACVVAGPVRLADVAELDGVDAAVLGRLRELVVAPPLRAGFPKRLSRQQLQATVAAAAGGIPVQWRGADSVALEAAAITVSGGEIVDQAAAYLYDVLAGDARRVVIRPVDVPGDVLVARGRVSLRPRPLPYAEALRHQARVWVDIQVDGAFYRSVPVSFSVEVWKQAWTAQEDLARGSVLRCDSIQRLEARVQGSGVPFEGACESGNLRLRRGVRTGQMLTTDAVEPVPAVSQGDELTLQFRVGAVALELAAVALSDARVGQTVQLKPSHGEGVLRAVVTARQQASLVLQ